ncbi:hypothetical protein Y032_0056g2673 [Ancylostoma ceylanicum]|uniref:Uncharacterized protein n=1 Tax=Ancylostoma ceylanicum TaxID=53326 RepID=A0A016U5T8_9BILA|nr:hypothetical protein Y032_0056g2673 [Ancylostoma ceylanicum]
MCYFAREDLLSKVSTSADVLIHSFHERLFEGPTNPIVNGIPMIIVIFTALAVVLIQFIFFCNKKDRSLKSEHGRGAVAVPSPDSRPSPDVAGSASGSKGSKAAISDSASGVRPTQESLETSPAYVEEEEVWEVAGELADEARAGSVPVRSVTKTQADSQRSVQGTPGSSKARTTPSEKQGKALKEASAPQAETPSEGEKKTTTTDPKTSRLAQAEAEDMWRTFKKLEETQPDLIDYTSLVADPVLDENEADEQKEHKAGSLGDLLLQLKWAKAARAQAETSPKRPVEAPPPEAQAADVLDNQFAELLPGLVPSKPPNKPPTNFARKSSNPSSKKFSSSKQPQPNLQSPKTRSKKGQVAQKGPKQAMESGKKNVRGSEKKSSKKKSSKRKRK